MEDKELQYIEDWIRRLDKKDRDIQKQINKIKVGKTHTKIFKRNFEQLKMMVKKYKNINYFAENFEEFRKEMLKERLEEKRNFEEFRKEIEINFNNLNFNNFKKEVYLEMRDFMRLIKKGYGK